jgi:cytochrome c-type biogenesis protein CcmH/NrfF
MLWLRVPTLGIKVAILLLGSLCVYGQSAEEIESPAVTRVVEKLNCTCGCKMNMACQMDPYPGCKICYAHRLKVLTMQKAGSSDQAILDSISQEEGKALLVNPPGTLGSLSFYTAGILGLVLVLFVIRKYRQKGIAGGAVGTEIDDPALNRYHEQIEKETAKLD